MTKKPIDPIEEEVARLAFAFFRREIDEKEFRYKLRILGIKEWEIVIEITHYRPLK